jgi:hypothetical protein
MPTKKTPEELAAEAAAAEATAKAQADADAEAAAKIKADAEAAEVAAKEEQAQAIKAASDAAAKAAEERVTGLYAATPAGFEAVRDEAIKSGSSVAAFEALIKAAKSEAAKSHASAIGKDTDANATVKPSTGKEAATGDEAAATAILASYAKAIG